MKIKLLFLASLFLVLLSNSVFAQNESNNWYFGSGAGISFASGSPMALNDGILNTVEGVATISDSSGNLLFYTDGSTVYNANHGIMNNGEGLLGNPSSTQSAIIVKKPNDDNLYYIFTVDYNYVNTSIIGNGLRYSVVDMSLDNGLGELLLDQKNILIRERAYEKLTAVRHANGTDFWILINDWIDDNIYAYHLSSEGLNLEPVKSEVGPFHGKTISTLGYLKASRQNNKIALARWEYNSFAILDFDNSTGIASNRIDIVGNRSTMYRTYGIEFSPDGTKLYGTTLASPYKVIQFDLTKSTGAEMFSTRTILATHSSPLPPCNRYYYGALQIGPDEKIYGVTQCDSFLNVINQPNLIGELCDYNASAISLDGRTSGLGLPNFVSDYTLPLSIKDDQYDENIPIKIYPNPTGDDLNINLERVYFNKLTLEIYDILGNKLFSSIIRKNEEKIDFSKYPAGIYFFKINVDGKTMTKKIIKK